MAEIEVLPKVEVRSRDSAVKKQRETAAWRVNKYFGKTLPPSRLLCFLDDDDSSNLRGERGLYKPICNIADFDGPLSRVKDWVYPSDRYGSPTRVIDDLIYLHGRTCADEVGLTMTLAHEVQHAIQHSSVRELWAVNSLVHQLPSEVCNTLKLEWADIPIEREARIVERRAAVHLFDEKRVTNYIDKKIQEHVSDGDVADWKFLRNLKSSDSVDFVSGTLVLFKRLELYRSELEDALQIAKRENDEDFGDIDIDAFLNQL
jgi:hypothetical protein